MPRWTPRPTTRPRASIFRCRPRQARESPIRLEPQPALVCGKAYGTSPAHREAARNRLQTPSVPGFAAALAGWGLIGRGREKVDDFTFITWAKFDDDSVYGQGFPTIKFFKAGGVATDSRASRATVRFRSHVKLAHTCCGMHITASLNSCSVILQARTRRVWTLRATALSRRSRSTSRRTLR